MSSVTPTPCQDPELIVTIPDMDDSAVLAALDRIVTQPGDARHALALLLEDGGDHR